MLQLILSKNPYAFLKRLNWFGLIRFGVTSVGEALRLIKWLTLKREIRKADERIAELETKRREAEFSEKFAVALQKRLAEPEKEKKRRRSGKIRSTPRGVCGGFLPRRAGKGIPAPCLRIPLFVSLDIERN